jgi:hypothetical protein
VRIAPHTSSFWANIIDVAPDNSGLIMGISNTVAALPGIIGNIFTGLFLFVITP